MTKLKSKRSKLPSRAKSGVGCPLFLRLFRPTLADIPVGGTVKPGLMLLEISTPPVFGKAGNEHRFLRYPIYPGLDEDTASPADTVTALSVLTLTNQQIYQDVEALKTLARTPLARAWARDNPDFVFASVGALFSSSPAHDGKAATGSSNSVNSK